MKRAAMPSENEIRENLTDAGCSRDETESILTCIRFGDIKAAEKIIAAKRIVIISTSPRRNSNSEALANAFAKGAAESGNDIEVISLRGKDMRFCLGCFACQKTGKCVIKDDMNEIVPKMEHADVLVFATPIYYYEMSGQMKTLLDRANPLFVSDYRFRDVYFLSSAAEDEDFVPQRAQSGLEGWIECFEKAHLTGSVFGGGVTDVGEIKGHHALAEAYEMGKAIR